MDWQNGKYVVEPDKDMKKYLEVYHDQFHLGKPRVSERLSANAYWVSLFSKLWKAYWKLNKNEENRYLYNRYFNNYFSNFSQ